jgi:hypothetical protein
MRFACRYWVAAAGAVGSGGCYEWLGVHWLPPVYEPVRGPLVVEAHCPAYVG